MEIKLFISQPMTEISEDKFNEDRNFILNKLGDTFPEIKFIPVNPYRRNDAPDNADPLWYLGRAIQELPSADAVIFAEDYTSAKGCIIEHHVCHLYKLPMIMERELRNVDAARKVYRDLFEKFNKIMKGELS